jgi:signal transduction histidine kinase
MFRFIRRRLYLQIYLAFIGIVLLIVMMVGTGFALFEDDLHERQGRYVSAIAEALLPPADAAPERVRERLESWHEKLGADITVLDGNNARVAYTGEPVVQHADPSGEDSWVRFRRHQFTAGVRLDDGRWLLVRQPRKGDKPVVLLLLVLASVIGLCAYPLARRITRRLERLRERVEMLGAGQLSARAEVEGVDEVADVATSFNRAAGRIEHLVNGQRAMLAGASHELRTPLTRMRMALELMDNGERPVLNAQMRDDIEELDHLIDELLLASRLELDEDGEAEATLDLLAVAAEEAARTGAVASGDSIEVNAQPRWLARAVRNLLENARKYGGAAVTVHVERVDGMAEVAVEDNGPGVPEELHELIFEPFFRPPGLREGQDRGVGLGLALVRQIAARHDGSVRCEARTGGGSRFVLRLPSTASDG